MRANLYKPTALALSAHIWALEAGDYYALTDDLPKHPGSHHGLDFPDE